MVISDFETCFFFVRRIKKKLILQIGVIMGNMRYPEFYDLMFTLPQNRVQLQGVSINIEIK